MGHPRARAVLVVEDESIVAHDMRQILAELGYRGCDIASSAEEAMARAAERRPDIALVDIRIRGKLDGIKTAQLLQERFSVPIVYLTAHADDATVQRAARTSPYGYLLKPVKPAELRSAIEIALNRHSAHPGATGRSPSPSGTAEPRPVASEARVPEAEAVRGELEQVLGSADFDASRRSREFLRFIVEEALAGRGEALSQHAIATEVFGRKDDFDALLDPIVRIQAGRLRRSLERYYLLGGKRDPVRIELRKGTYAPFFSAVTAAVTDVAAQGAEPASAGAMDSWPSIAVGPFDGAPESAAQEELALRLKEELTTELGRYRDLRVVLQSDADRIEPIRRAWARFELGGRLRREEDGWQITARLVDRTTGEQLWGDAYSTSPKPGRWSGTPEDVMRVIAARVGAEHGVVLQALLGEHRRRPAAGPYGAILRAHHFFFAREPRDFAPAVEALRLSLKESPETALAWTQLARLYLANYAFELSELPTPIDEAVSFAYQALRLDPSSARTRCVLASTLLVKGELQAGREELEQALRLNAGSLVYLEIVGWLMALLGEWDRGIALVRVAMERNPHHMPQAHHGLWADHLRHGRFEDAYRAALEYRDPTFFLRSMMRACCLGHLGRTSEARAAAAELLREKPGFPQRGRILIGRLIKPVELQDRVADGLRKAGVELA